MGARDLLHVLAGAGFQVCAEGGALLVRPVAALSPELRREIVTCKPQLLEIAPRRSWLISIAGREPFGVTCPQGATADEIRARWPGARVEPKLQGGAP